jgi:uncharacterized protein YjbJ (UPF0337 family)
MPENNVQQRLQGTLESLGDRIKRAFDSIMGHGREAAQEIGGQKKGDGGVAQRAEGAVKEGAGSLKREVGEVFGKERMDTEGRGQDVQGRERDLNQ